MRSGITTGGGSLPVVNWRPDEADRALLRRAVLAWILGFYSALGGVVSCAPDNSGQNQSGQTQPPCLKNAAVANYYVATAGDDSDPGTLARPWRTIQKAADVVQPGELVAVRGGTYAEAVHLTRGGTDVNPVTFQAYLCEVPILDGALLPPIPIPTAGFWIDNVPNVILDGFRIINFDAGSADSGAVLLSENTSGTSRTIIRNNTLSNFRVDGNPTGVSIQQYQGTVEIANNTIRDNNAGSVAGSLVNPVNNTCVVIFMDQVGAVTSNIWVHNNECYNEGVGFKFKHPPDPVPGSLMTFIVEQNLVHDIYSRAGIEMNGVTGGIARNNILYNVPNGDAQAAAILVGGENPILTLDTQVYNNTIYNAFFGLFVSTGSTGSTIRDNIFFGVPIPPTGISLIPSGLFLNQTPVPGQLIDFNDYAGTYTDSVACWGGFFAIPPCDNPANIDTLPEFRLRVPLPGFEANGINLDPRFVDPTGSPRDFHLQVGSPARGTGTGGLDMGAYPNRNEVIGPAP